MVSKKQGKKSRNNSNEVATRVPRGIPVIADGSKYVFGFPNRILSKLRYVDTYQIVSTTGSVAKQTMYVNSTFDPDNTGSGHQPMYRDVFASIYNHYSVVSADVTVTFVSNAATSSMVVGYCVDDDSSTSSTLNTLCEQNNGAHTLLPNATGALSSHTFKYHWDCKQILQIDPYASEEYKTNVGSNPTEISSIVVWAAPADAISTTTTTVLITLEQTVLWTELATQTAN